MTGKNHGAQEPGPPAFWKVASWAAGSAVALGVFVGVAIHDEPDAVVATVLLLVALFNALGLSRYAVSALEHQQPVDSSDATPKPFVGTWPYLPNVAATSFALAMALTAYLMEWGDRSCAGQ